MYYTRNRKTLYLDILKHKWRKLLPWSNSLTNKTKEEELMRQIKYLQQEIYKLKQDSSRNSQLFANQSPNQLNNKNNRQQTKNFEMASITDWRQE